MLREALIHQHTIGNHTSDGFRWRGTEIARIEGLSDAVFAFAVTLLVVSLEVPKTFNELAVLMRGFFPFAISFGLLMRIWYEQYLFFRRYNMQDGVSVFLNAVLLFVVLFYVYPLKFLWSFLINQWMGAGAAAAKPGGGFEPMIEPHQIPALMEIFSAGFLAVSCIFLLLIYRALRRRTELDLNPLEILETHASIGVNAINAATAVVSLGIAFFGGARFGGWAGMIYPVLLCPGFTIFYSIMGRRKRMLARAGGSV
ncbi:MAG TPA: TMEM175 family protein [Candidatus Acidoferrales bacterium]|jgi:hypothetical protein|nr:TMEM175 family protein [Candidatus Acidoferrales bacterium]